jgi:hypothetical protein
MNGDPKSEPQPDAVRFEFAQRVYLVADPEQCGSVRGILYIPGSIQYWVRWGDHSDSFVYDFELREDRVSAGG